MNCERCGRKGHKADECRSEEIGVDDSRAQPDWTRECIVCGAKPILPLTEMCGPCTFGEAETAGGNW